MASADYYQRQNTQGADNVDIENFYSKRLRDVLNATDDVQTRIANAFYLDKRYTIEKQYEATIKKRYSAKVEALDFEAPKATAQVIDKFISDTTEGKIQNMVNEQMVMNAFSLIVNAIYFKAKWLGDFNKVLTKKAIFHCSENKIKEIDFMNEYEKNRLYTENDDMQVLTLPYKDTTYSLSILLPKKRFALAAIRNKISGAALRELLKQVKMEFMTISIPKMKIETEFALKKALISMGITEMFSDNADFTGITKRPPLKVSDAAHRALIERKDQQKRKSDSESAFRGEYNVYISSQKTADTKYRSLVDEEGTVAAAATGAMIAASALAPQKKPITFIADHPFIFILTKNNSPIFTGQFIA